MAGRLRRTVVAVTLVALLLPLAAATSLADTGPPGENEVWRSGFQANAGEGECTTEGDIQTCISINVSLFSGKTRNQGSGAIRASEVCFGTFTDTSDATTGEFLTSLQAFGCTRDVGQGSSIERDLSSATIAPTTIALESFLCDQNECNPLADTLVTVEGTFAATSAATSSSFRNVFDDGFCISRDSFRGTSRGALFSGTIDGQAVEISQDENGFAEIAEGKSSSTFRCKQEA